MRVEKLWLLNLLPLLTICTGEVTPRKLVCVIGAGRAGLAAVKLLADKGYMFDVIAFERNSDVGGLWIYRSRMYVDEHGLTAHSGIYKNLIANTPKDSMVYPDYPDIQSAENRNFLSHAEFLEYLRNYTDRFQLRQYIKFNTLVRKVIPEEDSGDKNKTWEVETQNLKTNEISSTICDAIIVCNGRHSKPYKPRIFGLFGTFPGPILHSRSYRVPDDFKGMTMVILGAGASGVDIAKDLSGYAKKVYLSHRHKEKPFHGIQRPKNIKEVSGVVDARGKHLTLQDNSTIAADAFIFCTGYLLDFPFLDERSGIIVQNNEIRTLFRRALNMKFPTMLIVGLPRSTHYGQLYYDQVKWFINALKNNPTKIKYEDEDWRG